MLIDFVTSLIILSFAFRIMLMLISWPLHLVSVILITPVVRGRVDRAGYWTSLPGAKEPIVYLIIGAAAAFFSLVSYAEGLRAKAQGRLLGPAPEDKALWIAASSCLAVGLAGFVLFYLRPQYIMAVPGTDIFFHWVYRLAAWLGGYQVVQLILAVAILGYILFVCLRVMVNTFRLALGGLRRLFQRLRWWLKPAPAQEDE